jgi:3-isopropylmalate dehydratase small subunit
VIIKGLCHVYGDNVDTDRIIPGKFTKTLDMNELANHVLEDLDPDFRMNMKPGDILVGGSNFGCGSSREQAPLALKVAGVSLVVARSFARIFFRNAINIGLPLIEVKNHDIQAKEEIEVDLASGIVHVHARQIIYQGTNMPAVMMRILSEGGLVQYLNKYKTYTL